MKYARIIAAVAGQPWAIEPAKGRAVMEFLKVAAAGERVHDADLQAIEEEARRLDKRREARVAATPGGVAVIPIHGVMAQRVGLLGAISGGTSTDVAGRQISAAASDPDVKAIILHVESPGGSIYGMHELADRIYEARGRKPVIAQVDSYAASAAYWAASQASEIVVSPGGDVGSIGVYTMHEDISGLLDASGVKETLIYAGKYKVEGNPFEPLGDEAKGAMQDRVDSAYRDFLGAVSRGRGKDTGHVAEHFGQGRMVRFDEAVKRGMADRIATFDETLSRFQKSTPSRSINRAQEERRINLASQV
jgi:capsid assembly protease